MTNLRKILLIPALIVVSVSSFFSCGVDRWPEYAHLTELDTWMYDIMQQNYLWYQYMPGYDEVNLFQDPATFLSKAKWDKDSYSFVDSVWKLRCQPMDSTTRSSRVRITIRHTMP